MYVDNAMRCTIGQTAHQQLVNHYMDYQVIALDLDGTLLTPEKNFTCLMNCPTECP
jgi:hypothetical protein